MEMPLVEQVRSFNRTMTERVGVLNDHFLGRNHPLGEARLLWEIGEKGERVRELRRRLGLDSAYLSRLLRSLEKQGLVIVRASKDDGRVRFVQLTRAGLRERVELDQRADAFARSLLEPLSESQRVKLAAAMAQVERLLIASMVQITVADPTGQDARWCFERYFAELGERFETGFDPTLSISAHAHELVPPDGLLLVARLREEPVGCGALKFHENAVGELKRMWVAPRARGLGLGRRLLLTLEHEAREAGITILHLETNRTLIEAIEMYRHAGYQEVEAFNNEPYAHHWFEKRL
ncbi:MAG: bifunctional helix-turn-helix transcriptional regulator/GNAT family N-acetyltransferase [Ktedonobacteraceae bacterium]|nr:bifunctional helix-turn-helix transcriptional regulator/GNAT family N-acetyltransferase [Ktedonobacteraceae bacterium]MBO0794468.1 bifunctional helix-turn-helix transcriptional regulator/GNAT family N-acetyltransferase [Ktedonobacteraceae bacterium]